MITPDAEITSPPFQFSLSLSSDRHIILTPHRRHVKEMKRKFNLLAALRNAVGRLAGHAQRPPARKTAGDMLLI